MKPATRARLAAIGFRDHSFPGVMHLAFSGIEVRAVVHPWKGLALMFNHADTRRTVEGETFVAEDASIAEIIRALGTAVDEIDGSRASSNS